MRIILASLFALILSACAPTASTPSDPPPPLKMGSAVATGEACGGMMGLTCAVEADFCLVPVEAQCGAADGMGTCSPRPEMCTQDYSPVCGCDGQTYSNTCSAHAAGISVAYAGECTE